MSKMKIGIIGSRSFKNYDLLSSVMKQYELKIGTVVSGGARGADSLGERWAKEHNKRTLIFIPEWDKYGKGAGYIRNKDIVKNSDGIIAFWDGESKGTQHSFKLCKEMNVPLKVVKFDDPKKI